MAKQQEELKKEEVKPTVVEKVVEKIVEVQKEIDLTNIKRAGKLMNSLYDMDYSNEERKAIAKQAQDLLLEFINENKPKV